MVPTACRRIVWLAALLPLVASPARLVGVDVFLDDFESGDSCLWGVGTTTCPGFTITTPPLVVAAGNEATFCYYVHTGNLVTQGIRRVSSSMEGATRYVSLFTTHDGLGNPVDLQPPGTLTAGCSWFGPDSNSRRIYTAQVLQEELALPSDDGSGDPLALEFLANQPAVLVAHVLNDTVEPLSTAVTLNAYALAPAVPYTRTATLTTIHTLLTIPPGVNSHSTACAVPSAVEFWWFSTHTHSRAQSARIHNGGSDIVVSTTWNAPAVATFASPTFYEFGAGEQLTTQCDFLNETGGPISFGESYIGSETCVGLAYFFPATAPRYCVNGVLQP